MRATPAVMLAAAIACLLPAALQGQAALGTAFTYQGRLTDAGAPATGIYDLQFQLFDAATAGVQVGSTVTAAAKTVTAGVFTVSLDFGTGAFAGNARWLEVGVRPGGSSGAYTILTPRQPLTAAPHAQYAVDTTQVNGQPASFYLNLANQTGTLSVAKGGTGAASIAASPFLTKIIGSCAAGSSLQRINSDGTVTCATDAPRSASALATLDSTGIVGQYGSITIGTDGLGLISYYDVTNGHLKVAHCLDLLCGSVSSAATVDGAANVGSYTSITIGGDGLGLISYYDNTNGDLKVAHCANAACSSATVATLDSAGDVGVYTSITIGVDGLGLISYEDVTNGHLKTAHCVNAACDSATSITIDPASVVGSYTSITIGADALGLISYWDVSNFHLKVAHCANTSCSSASAVTLDSAAAGGLYTSITIGADGLGLISYWDSSNQNLKVAHCANAACGTATVATLDTGSVGQYTSIAIGADGLGLISYRDLANGDLKVAHCANVVCSSATVATLDSAGNVGYFTSITIGADGLGLISYWDHTNDDVKVAHCGNTACSPFVVRRR